MNLSVFFDLEENETTEGRYHPNFTTCNLDGYGTMWRILHGNTGIISVNDVFDGCFPRFAALYVGRDP